MSEVRRTISKCLYVAAAIIFLGQSLFGCFAVLGVGLDTLQDVLLDLSLTMAFPIFLLIFWSRKLVLLFLWVFFVVQWIDTCYVGVPPKLISPLANWHGISLFSAVILFTVATIFDGNSDWRATQDLKC
jgi:hypothetical protein